MVIFVNFLDFVIFFLFSRYLKECFLFVCLFQFIFQFNCLQKYSDTESGRTNRRAKAREVVCRKTFVLGEVRVA